MQAAVQRIVVVGGNGYIGQFAARAFEKRLMVGVRLRGLQGRARAWDASNEHKLDRSALQDPQGPYTSMGVKSL
jgi:nucleoside-diphosphate-sugar epimerase